jgi:GT2 family glycosyltransferase
MNNQTKQQRVHIVILNWNGWKDTLECLESVFRQDYDNYQVVVCDNDSADQSVAHILDWATGKQPAPSPTDHPLSRLSLPAIAKPVSHVFLDRQTAESANHIDPATQLVVIQTGGNLGFAGGNNVGLRYALQQEASDYIWLLNNDTVVEADTLTNMLRHSTELLAKGIKNTCGSLVRFYDDPDIVQALGGNRFNRWTSVASETLGRFLPVSADIDHDHYRQSIEYITGCSWLLPRSFLTEIGLMEEGYFLYYEEIDWVLRSEQNYQLTYADNASVYHKEGSSIGSKTMNRGPSVLSEFYMTRNKLLLIKKFYPARLTVVYLFTLLQAFNRLRRGQFDRFWLLIKVMFGKKTFP